MNFNLMNGAKALLKMLEFAASALSQTPADPEPPDCEINTDDTLPDCTQLEVNGLIISRYEDGAIRKENPVSGVIQEERPDGSLLVCLPSGKVISQQYRGEPLVVSDPHWPGLHHLARVVYTTIENERSLVYHYQDPGGHHLVDLATLRYFKLRERMTAGHAYASL